VTTPSNESLARSLTESSGYSPWLDSFAAVDRGHFIDSIFTPAAPGEWLPLHRDECSREQWSELVYSDAPLVTQVDGMPAHEATAPVSGIPTSSSSRPSLMLRTLDAATLTGTENVLEIGTGTGYSTALLCHRLGAEHVTSIEVDPDLAASASTRINAAGHEPSLVVGDGLDGYRTNAPYDAIITTCAVRTVPDTWLYQLSDRGTITTTLSGWMMASGLVHLRLDDNGDAHGRFSHHRSSYMLARPHERPPRARFVARAGRTRSTNVDPDRLQEWTPRFVAQLAAPSAELVESRDNVTLLDVATGSQAWTEKLPSGELLVHQNGPLRLWDQIEDALTQWEATGAPDQSCFGVSVTADTQRVWAGSPDGPSWALPLL
jgi:methyltransferase of ATP-grasp peptide maturase system